MYFVVNYILHKENKSENIRFISVVVWINLAGNKSITSYHHKGAVVLRISLCCLLSLCKGLMLMLNMYKILFSSMQVHIYKPDHMQAHINTSSSHFGLFVCWHALFQFSSPMIISNRASEKEGSFNTQDPFKACTMFCIRHKKPLFKRPFQWSSNTVLQTF